VELTKYNLEEAAISQAPAIEQWAFFLLYADRYEARRLRELLPGAAFGQAVSATEEIALKTEDRTMYDQREKAQRDYLWSFEGARLEGLEKGREEGLEKGHEEGLEEGLEKGLEKGVLVGKIQLLRQLLDEDAGSEKSLQRCSIEELAAMLSELQQRLRSRRH